MTLRLGPAFRISRLAALITVIALISAACASTRPSVEEWQPRWEAAVTGIPPYSTVGESPPRELCNETLVFLRNSRPGLHPTPDLAVDDTVTDWIDVAEDAFFECPPASQQIGSFADAYEVMDRLAAEVELVLDMDRSG